MPTQFTHVSQIQDPMICGRDAELCTGVSVITTADPGHADNLTLPILLLSERICSQT